MPLSIQALLLSFVFYLLTINIFWLFATLACLVVVLIGKFNRQRETE